MAVHRLFRLGYCIYWNIILWNKTMRMDIFDTKKNLLSIVMKFWFSGDCDRDAVNLKLLFYSSRTVFYGISVLALLFRSPYFIILKLLPCIQLCLQFKNKNILRLYTIKMFTIPFYSSRSLNTLINAAK